MTRTYHNHDIENYIDYHDIRYILHINKLRMYVLFIRSYMMLVKFYNEIKEPLSWQCQYTYMHQARKLNETQ